MLNRSRFATAEVLGARRVMQPALRDRLQVIPASPCDWKSFDPAAALQGDARSSDLSLAHLARLLCTAPARSAELRALWRECVVTAAFALRVGPRLGGDAASSAIAGLLHRLGDMLTLQGIAHVEHASRLRLEAATRAELCAEHGVGVLERVLRAWEVPPRAAATAAGWRRLHEFPTAAAEAAAVYLARLLAIEAITPEFCAPGVLERACEELGLPPARLAAVRGDTPVAALLDSLQ